LMRRSVVWLVLGSRHRIKVISAGNPVTGSVQMRRNALLFTVVVALLTSAGLAFQAGTDGPYKVLKTARVGGDGGADYIYADTVGRRIYIPRGATQAQAATDARPAMPASEKRLTMFDLDTLAPVGVIPGVGGNGATVCARRQATASPATIPNPRCSTS